tara:strand:- start:13 stop:462 length:450 start_codon:yes stop_codon:yes gene_type:complete
LNFLLSLNKKYILTLSILFFISLFLFLIFRYLYQAETNEQVYTNIVSNIDITEPKFAINRDDEKIFVSAKEGNFIDTNKILLKKEVLFKSNNFIIETEKVIFDRKEQTATTKTNSIFKSKNTIISSEGFDIYDNGSKIKFTGFAMVTLK